MAQKAEVTDKHRRRAAHWHIDDSSVSIAQLIANVEKEAMLLQLHVDKQYYDTKFATILDAPPSTRIFRRMDMSWTASIQLPGHRTFSANGDDLLKVLQTVIELAKVGKTEVLKRPFKRTPQVPQGDNDAR